MEKINQYIHRQSKDLQIKTIFRKINLNNNILEKSKKNLINDYNQWLYDLNLLIRNKLYRQALKDIEQKKYKYELLKNELWKFRMIKAKAILKVIKIKMRKYSKEIIVENSSQNNSLKFWFNQIFLTLEELILEFRYDINTHIDYDSKKILDPVQTLIEYHLEFIYYLCIFSIKAHEVIQFISYLSMIDRFIPYIPYMTKSKPLNYFQNIILFRTKLLIENCNYLSALENIKLVFKLCFREMLIIMDLDSELNINDINDANIKKRKYNKKILGFCLVIQKIILSFFLRGMLCEHLGYFKRSVESYRQCRYFSNKFMADYNKEIFKYFRNMEKKYLNYSEIFNDIKKQFLINNNLENKKEKYIKKKYIIIPRINMKYNSLNSNNPKLPILNNKKARLGTSFINSSDDTQKLESFLENIGDSLYKEEENRNNSIFKKFTKNDFVLSTVNMIDNLLSKEFKHILKKMKKVEINKPPEEINHLINWTFNIKRQKDFKNQISNKEKKIHLRNNSCIQLNNQNKQKILFKSAKSPLNLYKDKEKKHYDDRNSRIYISNHYKKLYNTKSNINELNTFDKLFRSKSILSSSKINNNKSNNNMTNKSFQKKNKKILKYPLDKEIFSKSLLNKKNYLDSMYEKELKFQKKLLELKGYDMQKVTNTFNEQQVINSAENEFKIIKCFAESQNTKKNLMNLVKETTGFQNWRNLLLNEKLINRSHKKFSIMNLKRFMLINHIGISKPKYDPDSVEKNNDEKSKILNMECAKLEVLEKKLQEKRKNLMNIGIKEKSKDKNKV